ncbi:MAG: cysteine protease [Alphaproteobacteria bacterium]|nr:cysteine protease [Alphaproteobacteria bacterium]HJP20860.1 cysteine protease [Alphaproteobacteria bacterium]
MIFQNPSGAPELACEACGCRWFDRQENACYECGEPVPASEIAEFAAALAAYYTEKGIEPPPDPGLE